MKFHILAMTTTLVVTGCTQPPANPMERHARLAMAGKLVAKECAGYAGGYDSVRRIREEADRNIVAARNLGATDQDLKNAEVTVYSAFAGAQTWTSKEAACNDMIGELAWATN